MQTTTATLVALAEMVAIDLALAADNAAVVRALAAGMTRWKRELILLGLGAALGFRLLFAFAALLLLNAVGLLPGGVLLLLWVAWKLWRDFGPVGPTPARARGFARGAVAVTLAGAVLALDNVLAVAGAAGGARAPLIAGLALAVLLAGLAADRVLALFARRRWLEHLGTLVVLGVAGRMVWQGWHAAGY